MAYTLLLADDSVTIQRVIELTFADEDVDVIAVSDGDQAIARAESSPPDIVLADIGMPGKNGYEVAKHIKQSPVLSHIPVVLLTGAFEPVDQERASEAGCDGVLAKPFEPQLVISRVKDLLAKSAPRTAGAAPAEPPVVAAPAAAPPAAPRVTPPAVAPPPAPAPAVFSKAAPEEDDTLTLPTAAEQWNTPAGQTFSPAPVTASRNESLDDYFDRLDNAFQHLGGPPPAPPAAPAPTPPAPVAAAAPTESPDVDWFGPDPSKAAPPSEPWDFAAPATAASAAETPDYPLAYQAPEPVKDVAPIAQASAEATAATPPEPVAQPVAPVRQPAAPEPQPESAPPAHAAPAMPALAVAASAFAHAPAELPRIAALPSLADAFAVILAAEQTDATAASWPATTPSTDALVDRVTERVLDRLSDQVVRDTVSDIVSQIAERLVQEEIERIKSAIK